MVATEVPEVTEAATPEITVNTVVMVPSVKTPETVLGVLPEVVVSVVPLVAGVTTELVVPLAAGVLPTLRPPLGGNFSVHYLCTILFFSLQYQLTL